jgi:hypothetical protein
MPWRYRNETVDCKKEKKKKRKKKEVSKRISRDVHQLASLTNEQMKYGERARSSYHGSNV